MEKCKKGKTQAADLPIHLPDPGEAVVKVVPPLRPDINVVCVKDCPAKQPGIKPEQAKS